MTSSGGRGSSPSASPAEPRRHSLTRSSSSCVDGTSKVRAMQPVLVITGMHRSGTSVITAAFASAGLDVGSRLMPAARGNPRGHFEDLDFVSLHERMLRANGFGPEGFTAADAIPVPPALAAEARDLVGQRRSGGSIWGWKDPRTTLFLDWWAEAVPDARFVFLFRSPAEAIDSLFRRGDETFAVNPAFALDVWTAYNRRLLAFHQTHPERSLLVDAATAVAAPDRLVATVRKRWNLPLAEPEHVAAEGLFCRAVSQDRRAIVAAVQPTAWELFAALQHATGHGESETILPPQSLPAIALAEWSRGANLEGRVTQAEAHVGTAEATVEVIRQERDAARDELAARTRERDAIVAELESVHGRLHRPRLPIRAKIVREVRRFLRRRAGRLAESLGHDAAQPGAASIPLPPRAAERRAAA